MQNPTVLITGASGGIGGCFARLCAARKWNVVLVARDEAKLQTLAQELHTETHIFPVDLADPLQIVKLKERLDAAHITIDILINNAGFGSQGAFAEQDLGHELQMIDVNARALLHLTGLFLPAMAARGLGYILNVASTAAFGPGPFMATYFATKACVLSFSLALKEECRGTGVGITVLCPGPTATDFDRKANAIGSFIFRGKLLAPMDVARAGIEGMLKGKAIVIPGIKNRILCFLPRIMPRPLVLAIGRRILQKPPRPQA
jgi:short-subunit dehydrogenase